MYSCNAQPAGQQGDTCTRTAGLSANRLYEISTDVSLGAGDTIQHAWLEIKYVESSIVKSAVSQNMYNWVGGFFVSQMLYVITGSAPGSVTFTLKNTDSQRQVYNYNFQVTNLQSRSYSSTNSASTSFHLAPGGGQCLFLTVPAGALSTIWGTADPTSGNRANYFTYLVKYDSLSSNLMTDRFTAYREGITGLESLYPAPASGTPQVAMCVYNVDSSTQDFTVTISYRSASGSISPASQCSNTVNTNTVQPYSDWGPNNICTVTDTTKLYVAYVRLSLYSPTDPTQYVNWVVSFDVAQTAQAWYNWNFGSADTVVSKPTTAQSVALTIHNYDSAAQSFTYAYWVFRL
jgi:hypothetical protein